jgi:hypothetical protein
MPEIKNSFVCFEIEMLFDYPDDEGGQHIHWYHGVVTKIINQKKNIVRIGRIWRSKRAIFGAVRGGPLEDRPLGLGGAAVLFAIKP